jgi:hypothetical protein
MWVVAQRKSRIIDYKEMIGNTEKTYKYIDILQYKGGFSGLPQNELCF